MKMQRILSLMLVAILVVTLSSVTMAASVDPVWKADNPTCQDLGYTYGLRIDPPTPGTYTLGTGTVTLSTDGTYADWSSTFGVDALIVKGGPNANLYAYDPPEESFGDTGLHSPLGAGPGGTQPYGISHIDFCYDYEVVVEKTAETSFTRTWTWTINKVAYVWELTLMPGQIYAPEYEVNVSPTAVDSDWAVAGTITIHNPDPTYDAVIDEVDDGWFVVPPPNMASVLYPVDDVSCGVDFPYTLLAGQTLECIYSNTFSEDPRPDDAGYGFGNLARVWVDPDSMVGSGRDEELFNFGEPTTEIDECVDVTDDLYGPLGTHCAPYPEVFLYYLDISYDECGEYDFVNIASFVTNDTGATDSDDHTIHVTVPCMGGCTLTPGYWKTHSEYGPAPYDDTWALLPDGADTVFHESGQTLYEVLWTLPVGGNAYYILAHQYIAAVLNGLNGADTTAVDDILFNAETLFNTYTPDQVAAMKGKAGKELRAEFIDLAETLDSYNNGYIGPGHCSE